MTSNDFRENLSHEDINPIKRLVFGLVMLFGVNTLLHAEAPQQSSNDQILALSRHISEFQEHFRSDDSAVRAAAIEVAISDKSPTVRGMAIAALLNRFNALTPEFVLGTAPTVELRDLPRVAITGIKWSADGHSFTGAAAYPVEGQIADGKLAIRYVNVEIQSRLFAKASNTLAPADSPAKTEWTNCSVSLVLNDSHNALEGPLRCERLPVELKLRLAFGG